MSPAQKSSLPAANICISLAIMTSTRHTSPNWTKLDGSPVSCVEKLKVLQQNLDEFRAMALEFLEDAALMECDVDKVRSVLKDAVDAIPAPYAKTNRIDG